MNKPEYERMYRVEDSHWWYRGLHDLVIRHVSRESAGRKGLSLLDAGCGTGRLCSLLTSFGDVAGCDVSSDALAFCRERGLGNVFHADLNQVDLGCCRYDIITAIDVLYHRNIRDDHAVVARFHRALKPGGLLIVNLVAFEFLRSTHDIAVHTRKRYRRKEAVEMLERAGLQVETAAYRLGFLFPPIACYRLARRILHAGGEASAVDSDVRLPSPGINRLLLGAVLLENRLVQRGLGPAGSSVFLTARKSSQK
ncbi:bifunctional 2-polyprenyl-6-hydroxyphenol methylase/3-demethylubiquinol 3-O-methyltransferase UbiG [Geobacter sp. DSM 9736]|uniref:class I SAM-dependent methyltransferase n=1 Tax=Geobacter sp. DSM 9736 TaxID=1277350 RepID=UPI000B50E0C0|nr:class I SAM-dependent methyltransferase [Geobacter sp. DSM 9736]SNB44905.1 2-polyprenyl-3-methyl-5-hydroxy-6-metoxy-1,4-benzoquinol methylase [Geobacter sp. DSM 9736]